MAIAKSYKVSVQRRNLITLPSEIRKKLNISEGDAAAVSLSYYTSIFFLNVKKY